MKHRMPCAVFAMLLWVGDVDACVMFPAVEYPTIQEAVRAADIVAVIHVDRVEWRSPEEEAEFRRLWERPPMNITFSYPAMSARFTVKRILKGRISDEASIRSGPTNCEVGFQAGKDYVLFATLPAGNDDRLSPWGTTFVLDATNYGATKLADVESFLTPTKSSKP